MRALTWNSLEPQISLPNLVSLKIQKIFTCRVLVQFLMSGGRGNQFFLHSHFRLFNLGFLLTHSGLRCDILSTIYISPKFWEFLESGFLFGFIHSFIYYIALKMIKSSCFCQCSGWAQDFQNVQICQISQVQFCQSLCESLKPLLTQDNWSNFPFVSTPHVCNKLLSFCTPGEDQIKKELSSKDMALDCVAGD